MKAPTILLLCATAISAIAFHPSAASADVSFSTGSQGTSISIGAPVPVYQPPVVIQQPLAFVQPYTPEWRQREEIRLREEARLREEHHLAGDCQVKCVKSRS